MSESFPRSTHVVASFVPPSDKSCSPCTRLAQSVSVVCVHHNLQPPCFSNTWCIQRASIRSKQPKPGICGFKPACLGKWCDMVGPHHPRAHLNCNLPFDLSKASWNSGFAPGFIGFAPRFAPCLDSEFEGSLAKFTGLPPTGADLFIILKKGPPTGGNVLQHAWQQAQRSPDQNFSQVYVPAPRPVS